MSDHTKVKFLLHAPPYMPGDFTTIPSSRARILEAKGHVLIVESAARPKIEAGRAEFNPTKSPLEEVRAFIAGKGVEVSDKASEAQLRSQAAELLPKPQS